MIYKRLLLICSLMVLFTIVSNIIILKNIHGIIRQIDNAEATFIQKENELAILNNDLSDSATHNLLDNLKHLYMEDSISTNSQLRLFNTVGRCVSETRVGLTSFPDHLEVSLNGNSAFVQPVICRGSFANLTSFAHLLESKFRVPVLSLEYERIQKSQNSRHELMLTLYLNEVQ